ncbi:hypothetical protein ACIRBY_14730 [Streptomyces sp. NPDC096136]|uniref:hypothetical protein n=1 Tax=Streptomyces sp. NPDC096136 TaxID=3366076 RepID=UPI0038169A73
MNPPKREPRGLDEGQRLHAVLEGRGPRRGHQPDRRPADDGSFIARITVIGLDGKPWQRVRPNIGGSWTARQVAPNVG